MFFRISGEQVRRDGSRVAGAIGLAGSSWRTQCETPGKVRIEKRRSRNDGILYLRDELTGKRSPTSRHLCFLELRRKPGEIFVGAHDSGQDRVRGKAVIQGAGEHIQAG